MLSILIIVTTHKFVFIPVKLVHTISVKVHKKGSNYKKYKQRNKPITTTAAKRFKIYSLDEFDGILYINSGDERSRVHDWIQASFQNTRTRGLLSTRARRGLRAS